jgi:hypothetical protein
MSTSTFPPFHTPSSHLSPPTSSNFFPTAPRPCLPLSLELEPAALLRPSCHSCRPQRRHPPLPSFSLAAAATAHTGGSSSGASRQQQRAAAARRRRHAWAPDTSPPPSSRSRRQAWASGRKPRRTARGGEAWAHSAGLLPSGGAARRSGGEGKACLPAP